MSQPMTTDELREIAAQLDWSLGYLAQMAKRDRSRVMKMASGRFPIDDDFARWLRTVAAGAPRIRRDDGGISDHLSAA